jgi:hypothetical protein
MSAKTSNLLNILAAFGMIAAGIIAIYDEDMLFTAIGIYFICKGLFVTSLMQHIQKGIKSNCRSTITKS